MNMSLIGFMEIEVTLQVDSAAVHEHRLAACVVEDSPACMTAKVPKIRVVVRRVITDGVVDFGGRMEDVSTRVGRCDVVDTILLRAHELPSSGSEVGCDSSAVGWRKAEGDTILTFRSRNPSK
jgi:hypothetical protein